MLSRIQRLLAFVLCWSLIGSNVAPAIYAQTPPLHLPSINNNSNQTFLPQVTDKKPILDIGFIALTTVTPAGKLEGSTLLRREVENAVDAWVTDEPNELGVGFWVEEGRLFADVPMDILPGIYPTNLVFKIPSGSSNTLIPALIDVFIPDSVTAQEGWVTGYVYDSAGCDIHLTQCPPLANATITMAKVDPVKLAEARAMRTQQLRAANYSEALRPSEAVEVTIPLAEEVKTKADGSFAISVPDTGIYWLRAEKDGYTYAQRELGVVAGRNIATNALFLTPIDSAVTVCDSTGCNHTNSDGSIQLVIPPDAIPDGEEVNVTATNFEQVEYLPSGELPGDTWETYAFNLGGDSDFAFALGTQAIVRLRNDKGFAPGTEIPIGYWNQSTQAWEHAQTAIVDSSGEWLEMSITHFSNYDCNDPIAPLADTAPEVEDQSDDDEDPCGEVGEKGCFISLQKGTFEETVALPPIPVLGQNVAPELIYNSSRAYPNEVIDTKLKLDVGPGATLGDHISYELFIEGQKTQNFTFESDLTSGEVGRYRYLWDGRDGQGNLLPPGVYEYAVKHSLPYRSEYCYALNGIFGNPPDCENGATGRFVDATEEVWSRGTIELDTQITSPFGAGWVLNGQQRLYEDEAGRIMIADGQRQDEFYFSGKDLLGQQQKLLAINTIGIIAADQQPIPVMRHDGAFSPGASPSNGHVATIATETEINNAVAINVQPWRSIASYPFAIMDNVAVEVDGLIYSIGGFDGQKRLKTGYVYNPATDTWSSIADMKINRAKPAAAVINGQLYVAGGWSDTTVESNVPSNSLEIYNPIANTWRVAAPMPRGLSAAPGVAVNGKFYVIGGCADQILEQCTPSADVFRYDSNTNTWEEVAPYPILVSWNACSVIAGNIYCAGGLTSTTGENYDAESNHTYVYNPATDQWTRLTNMPQTQWGAGYTATNGKLLISGGVTNDFATVTNESFIYDPATDEWSAFDNSNNILYRGASACGFYRIGGSAPGDFNPRRFAEVYPGLTDCETEPTIYSRTATDYSILSYDEGTETYSRRYPNGTVVYFRTDGRHDSTIEPDGRKTSYSYNPNGSLAALSITAPGETSPRWQWNFAYANGKLQSITDPGNRVTNVTINAQGDLTAFTTPDDATRKFGYDDRHLVTSYIDQDEHVTTHSYDEYGRIISLTEAEREVYNPETGQTQPLQEVRTFTPSETGYALINDSVQGNPETPAPAVQTSEELVDQVTYGRGGRSGQTSRWGSWLSMTDGIGRTVAYERDQANNVTRMTYGDGSCVEFDYDTLANVIERRQMAAVQCQLDVEDRDLQAIQRWAYTYEARFSQLKSEIDPEGNTTLYTYDYEEGTGEAGQLIRIDFPATTIDAGTLVTPTVRYTYNTLGLLESVTDETGLVTRYRYTPEGWLAQVVENEGGHNLTITYQDFDAAGNPHTIIDSRGNRFRYTYDGVGRILTETDPLNVVTKYEYDGRGNLVRMVEDYTANGTGGRNLVTTFTYDAKDNLLTRQTVGDGITQAETYSYDINGKLATFTDSEGQTTLYVYDNADQLISITDPLGHTTALTYTVRGEVAGVTQADGSQIQLSYDVRGNLVGLTPPGQPTHSFAYTLRDQVAVYTPPDVNPSEDATTYTYNTLGQATAEVNPDGEQIGYGYDAAQRLKARTLPEGGMAYGYDPATNQLTSISAPSDVALSYGYDKELLTSTSWSGAINGRVGYSYDSQRRLTELAVNDEAPIPYEYDTSSFLIRAGALTLNRLPQSRLLDTTTIGQISDQWEYDDFGKATRYTASNGGTTLYRVDYTYDDLDRLTTQTELIGGTTTTYAYRYDAIGRLIEVKRNELVAESYTYDANGNRLTGPGGETGTYDDQDRQVTYGNATYSYTANGDLATKTVGGQTTAYNYDAIGNLLSATLPNGNEITYLVDGQDRRVGKNVNGALVQGFLYQDQLEPIAELNASGDVVSRFIYGTRPHVPDYMVKDGMTYRIITDHLGSVRLVVNSQTGAIAQRIDYDAWGKVLQDTSPGFQPFGFAGGIYDRDTGLVRFGARDYDAQTGRWTTKDPIGFEGGTANLYEYSENNPVNFIDPSGKFAFLIPIIIGVWTVAEVGLSIADAVSTVDTLLDPCATLGEKSLSSGLFAVGVVLPGGGYSTGAKAYHYTHLKNADSISLTGLEADTLGRVFTTPNGNLSPLQAQIELALSPNRGLPGALFEINLTEVQRLGIGISSPQRIASYHNVPGGGTELIINGPIPPTALRRIR